MHKLILGIIAVAFIQIGFIAVVSLNSAADNASMIVKPLSGQISNPDAGIFDSTFTQTAENNDIASPNPNRRTFIRAGVRVAKKREKQPTQSFVPKQVVITYAVSKPYKFIEREPYKNFASVNSSIVNKSEIAEHPATKPEKRDDPTLLAIVKKPFGWIKALGSKLK